MSSNRAHDDYYYNDEPGDDYCESCSINSGVPVYHQTTEWCTACGGCPNANCNCLPQDQFSVLTRIKLALDRAQKNIEILQHIAIDDYWLAQLKNVEQTANAIEYDIDHVARFAKSICHLNRLVVGS